MTGKNLIQKLLLMSPEDLEREIFIINEGNITELVEIVGVKLKTVQIEGDNTWGVYRDTLILIQGIMEYLDVPCDIN